MKTKAFTLVELIVTITILAILGTIAFISLQGYSTSARDSTRISDLSSMRSSLELFQLDSGKYPNPTNSSNITYSGGIVWTQGIFGESVFINITKLDKIPLDPSTDKEYTYSITQNKNNYQLGGIIEGDTITFNNKITSNSYAGYTEATAYVTGNYNGLMTKSNSGEICNIITIPSIITNDLSVTDLPQIATSGSFVYRGYKNLPGSFKNSKFKYNGGFDFKPNNIVAYSDTGSCITLNQDTNSGSLARLNMLKSIQNTYSGSLLKDYGEIKKILSLDISDINNPSIEVKNYAGTFINNNLGGSMAISTTTNTNTGNNNNNTNNTPPTTHTYNISYINSNYFTTNSNGVFNNGLKLVQIPSNNLCISKPVTCNATVTYCTNSCNGVANANSSATYDAGQTGTTWIKYDLGSPAVVNNLSIWSYYASGFEGIKDYQLYGSNDNVNYVFIDSGTHANDTTPGYLNYNVNNLDSYRYYRFDILSHYPGNGGNNRMLRDLKLSGTQFYTASSATIETLSGKTMNFSTLGGILGIQQININDTLPSGTSTKYLFSFDGKNTWKYFDGTSWQTAASGVLSIGSVGMTSAFINGLTSGNYSGIENQTSIDIAVNLSSTNNLNTPVVNNISITYTK